jgi:hypothetical protein
MRRRHPGRANAARAGADHEQVVVVFVGHLCSSFRHPAKAGVHAESAWIPAVGYARLRLRWDDG